MPKPEDEEATDPYGDTDEAKRVDSSKSVDHAHISVTRGRMGGRGLKKRSNYVNTPMYTKRSVQLQKQAEEKNGRGLQKPKRKSMLDSLPFQDPIKKKAGFTGPPRPSRQRLKSTKNAVSIIKKLPQTAGSMPSSHWMTKKPNTRTKSGMLGKVRPNIPRSNSFTSKLGGSKTRAIELLSSDDEDDSKDRPDNLDTALPGASGLPGLYSVVIGEITMKNCKALLVGKEGFELQMAQEPQEGNSRQDLVVTLNWKHLSRAILCVEFSPCFIALKVNTNSLRSSAEPGHRFIWKHFKKSNFPLKHVVVLFKDTDKQYKDFWGKVVENCPADKKREKFLATIKRDAQIKDISPLIFFSAKRSKEESTIFTTYPRNHPNSIVITNTDLDVLREGEFLNDTIVDFYLRYIQETNVQDKHEEFHFFNSFFYKRYITSGSQPAERHKHVAKWTAKVDIFEKKFIIVPINQRLHWSLAIIINPGKKKRRILYLDSLCLPNQYNRLTHQHLESYLAEEYFMKKSQGKPGKRKHYTIQAVCVKVPQQTNDVDCGVYMLHYIEKFCQTPFNGNPDSLDKSRWFALADLKKKRSNIRSLLNRIAEGSSETEPMNMFSPDPKLPESIKLPVRNDPKPRKVCTDSMYDGIPTAQGRNGAGKKRRKRLNITEAAANSTAKAKQKRQKTSKNSNWEDDTPKLSEQGGHYHKGLPVKHPGLTETDDHPPGLQLLNEYVEDSIDPVPGENTE